MLTLCCDIHLSMPNSDLLVDRILFANLGKGTRKINADYEPPVRGLYSLVATSSIVLLTKRRAL